MIDVDENTLSGSPFSMAAIWANRRKFSIKRLAEQKRQHFIKYDGDFYAGNEVDKLQVERP